MLTINDNEDGDMAKKKNKINVIYLEWNIWWYLFPFMKFVNVHLLHLHNIQNEDMK